MFAQKANSIKISVRKDLYKKQIEDKGKEKLNIYYFCNICIQHFKTQTLLNRHLTIVHRPLTVNIHLGVYCDRCTYIFDERIFDGHKCNIKRWEPVLRLSKSNKKCRICYTQFKSKGEILLHLLISHRPTTTINIETDVKTSFCEDCQKHFQEGTYPDHFPCKAVDVKCFFCLTVMPTKPHFLEHNLTWVTLRSFQCNLCDFDTKTMTFTELNNHMKKHNKYGVYKCVRCKLWLEKDTLALHLDCYHNGCRCLSEKCHCEQYNEFYYISKVLKDVEEDTSIPLKRPRRVYSNSKMSQCKTSISTGFDENQTQETSTKIPDNSTNTIDLQEASNCQLIDISETILNQSEKQEANKTNLQETSNRQTMETFDQPDNNSSTNKINKQKPSNCQSMEIFDQSETEEDSSESDSSTNKINLEESQDDSSESDSSTNTQETPNKIAKIIVNQSKDDSRPTNKIKSLPDKSSNIFVTIYQQPEDEEDDRALNKTIPNTEISDTFSDKTETEQESSEYDSFFRNVKQKKPSGVCIVCGLNFDQYYKVIDHAVKYHRPWAVQMQAEIYCPPCDSWFNNDTEYRVHHPCKRVPVKKNCHICNMEAPFTEHFFLHNIVYLSYNRMCCTLCENNNKEFTLQQLNKHRQIEHKKNGVYECLKCEVTFVNSIELKRHVVECKINVDTESLAKKYQLKINKESRLEHWKCQFCDKIYFSALIFQRHLKTHEPRVKRKYLCYICGLTFKNGAYFKRHQNLAHLKNITFKCKSCDKKFYARKYLIQHERIHTKTKNFNCEVCKKVFVQQTSLIYHMATHTNENVFKCTVCDRMFNKQSMLTSHMEEHNKNGTNPHKCDICNKFFSHKCKLLVHMRIHPKASQD